VTRAASREAERLKGEAEMIRRTLIGLIALVSSAAQADYLTYQSWSALPDPLRYSYIAGAMDAVNGVHFNNCIASAKMTTGQLAANVMDFARDKPELQTGSVQRALLGYLNAACGILPTK
jgi:hypothetical protein